MEISITKLLLIAVVILLLFGPKKIPELAKALGRASYEYKKAKDIIKKEAENFAEEAENTAKLEKKTTEQENA